MDPLFPPQSAPRKAAAAPARRGADRRAPRHDAAELIGWREPSLSPVRYVTAAFLLVVATAHLLVVEDQFERAGYLGGLFVGIAGASLSLAVLLAWRDYRLVWLASVLTAEVAIAVFVLDRMVGLPAVTDDLGRWTDPVGVLAVTLETAVLLLAGGTVYRRQRALRWSASRLPLVGGLVALQVGAVATFAAASLPAGPAQAAGSSHVHAGVTDAAGYWSQVGGAAFHPTGTVRSYYIAADEVVWDYAPTGKNQITGKPFDETADTYVKTGPGRIGSRYLKCLYRGYTDGSFTTRQDRPADQAYLGLLGPVIRAAVGDTIKVIFRNTCHIPASVHPHGVFYQKASEGAPYADNTTGADTTDDAVPTGGTHTYTWLVPDRAGPGPHDGSSVMWMYHSHTDEVGDTYAGLMGPMEITTAAMARPDGSPNDVDREIFELYAVMNENNSPYLKTNLERFAQRPYPPAEDEEFTESNLMHSINGYVYGNQPMITLTKGQRVRWYVMDMGTEVDLHTPHWHGNDVVVAGMRMDVINLLPASMAVADMVPDNPGTWLFHCHVNDHLTAGMITRYQVVA
jgi:hypothetical protein